MGSMTRRRPPDHRPISKVAHTDNFRPDIPGSRRTPGRVQVNNHMKKDKILAEVLQHNCTNCSDFVSVFVSVDIPKTDKHRQKESRHRQKTKIPNVETQFPPKPASHSNVESIIAGFAKDVQVANFLESGCAVCGLLTSGTQLQKLDCAEFDIARGLVTRQERFSVNDPVIEIPGPVLLPHCNDICTSCLKELQNGKLPVDSLANGL